MPAVVLLLLQRKAEYFTVEGAHLRGVSAQQQHHRQPLDLNSHQCFLPSRTHRLHLPIVREGRPSVNEKACQAVSFHHP